MILVLGLVRRGKGIAFSPVRLERVHSMVVEPAVVLAHAHLVHALQPLVDPAAVVLQWLIGSGLLVLLLGLEGGLVVVLLA